MAQMLELEKNGTGKQVVGSAADDAPDPVSDYPRDDQESQRARGVGGEADDGLGHVGCFETVDQLFKHREIGRAHV